LNNDDIVQLMQQGRKIDAIKLYRERTNVGLAEAKAAVEALGAGQEPPEPETMNLSAEVQINSFLQQGQKIEAIKVYREHTGVGLKEAKDAIEKMQAPGQKDPPVPVLDTNVELEILSLLEQGQKIQALKLYREKTGYSLYTAKRVVGRMATEHGIATPPGSGCLGAMAMMAVAVGLACLIGLLVMLATG
jgi:ribosomal protein L7/L12